MDKGKQESPRGASESNASAVAPLPKAVKQATILGGRVDCYLLQNALELISGRGTRRALSGNDPSTGGAKDGKLARLLGNLPDEYAHLRVGARVRFVLPGGGVGEGITPLQFADIVAAYASLFLAGKLRKDQAHIGKNACIIQGAAAKLGYVELVSEALGTTRPAEDRHRQRLFDRLLRAEATKWELTFEPSLARALARFYGIDYVDGPYPRALQWIFGWIYNTILGKDVADEMRRRNVDPERLNHHQIMTDAGRTILNEDLRLTEAFATTSFSRGEFMNRMSAHYCGTGLQKSLF